jgi:hypothetical protein
VIIFFDCPTISSPRTPSIEPTIGWGGDCALSESWGVTSMTS